MEICWVSAHIGIDGNERADKAAKSATERPALPPADYISVAKKRMGEKWNTVWVKANTKMKSIKAQVGPWKYEKRI